MASGGMVLVKYLLFFFNFIFWLSGLALIILGAVIKVKYGDFIQVSSSSITTAPVFLIIIGAIIFIVGFLGCCGAWKENYCMITTFAVILAIIFILEIAAGAVAYVYRGKIKTYVENGVDNALKKYNDTKFSHAMNTVQSKLKCCGSNGPSDYPKGHIPKSCHYNTTAYYETGCVSALENYLKEHLAYVGGVGIGIAFIQLIGILFACCLMRSIKKEYEVM